jgi:hypothetical protein
MIDGLAAMSVTGISLSDGKDDATLIMSNCASCSAISESTASFFLSKEDMGKETYVWIFNPDLILLSFLTSLCVSKILAFLAAFLTSFSPWCYQTMNKNIHFLRRDVRACL